MNTPLVKVTSEIVDTQFWLCLTPEGQQHLTPKQSNHLNSVLYMVRKDTGLPSIIMKRHSALQTYDNGITYYVNDMVCSRELSRHIAEGLQYITAHSNAKVKLD
jgi:hypothetical protein